MGVMWRVLLIVACCICLNCAGLRLNSHSRTNVQQIVYSVECLSPNNIIDTSQRVVMPSALPGKVMTSAAERLAAYWQVYD